MFKIPMKRKYCCNISKLNIIFTYLYICEFTKISPKLTSISIFNICIDTRAISPIFLK